MNVFGEMAVCFGWGMYCHALKKIFDQPRGTDHVATLIGVLAFMYALSQ